MVGACVRVTWARVDSEQVDLAPSTATGWPPFPRSASSTDSVAAACWPTAIPDSAVASVTFDGMSALRRSRAAMDEMKAATVRDSGAEIVDECEFDPVLAHLRVPELA